MKSGVMRHGFIFLTRHYESPLDFDLELGRPKKQMKNPVYYVQLTCMPAYPASAKKAAAENNIHDVAWDENVIQLLQEPEEIQLIRQMGPISGDGAHQCRNDGTAPNHVFFDESGVRHFTPITTNTRCLPKIRI